MLFDSEIFQTIKIGDKLTAYVKEKRKDGKLDISLQPIGKKQSTDLHVDTDSCYFEKE